MRAMQPPPSADGEGSIDIEQQITVAVHDIVKRRAVIEQAKGMMMLVYGITADAAFDTLKWRSQVTNVKLRVLAERLVDSFVAINRLPQPKREDYDAALLRLSVVPLDIPVAAPPAMS